MKQRMILPAAVLGVAVLTGCGAQRLAEGAPASRTQPRTVEQVLQCGDNGLAQFLTGVAYGGGAKSALAAATAAGVALAHGDPVSLEPWSAASSTPMNLRDGYQAFVVYSHDGSPLGVVHAFQTENGTYSSGTEAVCAS